MGSDPVTYSDIPQGFQIEPDQQFSDIPPGFKTEQSWSDVGKQAVKNLPSSAYKLAEGASKLGTPFGISEIGTNIAKDPKGFANGLLNHIKQYTSIEGFKKALATDPAGVAADILGVASPVIGALGKAGEAGEAASATRVVPKLEVPQVEPAAVRAAKMKSEAGASMQEAKDAGETASAETIKPLLDTVKESTKSTYNKHLHKATKSMFKRLQDMLPDKEPEPFIPTMAPSVRASMLAKYPDLVGTIAKEPSTQTVTMKDMHDLLQSTRDISASGHPQEVKSASAIKDALDEHIEKNFPSGEQFTGSKLRYAIASTALDLKNLVQRAALRQSQSTSQTMDKTLATEFRNFTRNDRKMRMLNGISPEAATKLRNFVSEEGEGGSMRKILRGLGSASPNSVLSFSLDNIAGHLLHHIIPGGPYTIMAVGAGAKYLGGKMASQSIEDIMDTVLASDDINKLEGLVSEPVSTKLASQPATKQAVVNWAKSSGKAKTVAAHGLAIAIARQLNTPKLVPRIEQEINGLDNQNVTDVKEQLP